MRRTVTIEIDTARFSKAFSTMSGETAKETLVMLVCGGHAVSSHSACLSDVGVYPAKKSDDPCVEEARVNSSIAKAAEEFLTAIGTVRNSDILAALADRPRPGTKAKARQELMSLLGAIYDLRKGRDYSRPLQLVGSGGGRANEPMEILTHV